MIRSVSSTYSAIRRVSRSAITMTSQGQTCVNTPILDTLRLPRHLSPIPGQRSSRVTEGRMSSPPVEQGDQELTMTALAGTRPEDLAGRARADILTAEEFGGHAHLGRVRIRSGTCAPS